MGFSARLLITYLEARTPGIPVWKAREVVDFGDITRLEKLTGEAGAVESCNPHKRAGICAMRMILDRLWPRADDPRREWFAPDILVYREHWSEDQARAVAEEAGATECLDCGTRNPQTDDIYDAKSGTRYPSLKRIREHNLLISLEEDELRDVLKRRNYHVITEAPIMWARCEEIAEWMREDELGGSPAFQEAVKDAVSYARVTAWRKYLREIGRVDARALFLFPSCDHGI